MIGRYLPVVRDGFIAARQRPLWASAFMLGVVIYLVGVLLLGFMVASTALSFLTGQLWP